MQSTEAVLLTMTSLLPAAAGALLDYWGEAEDDVELSAVDKALWAVNSCS